MQKKITEQEISNVIPSYRYIKKIMPPEEFKKFREEIKALISFIRMLGNPNTKR